MHVPVSESTWRVCVQSQATRKTHQSGAEPMGYYTAPAQYRKEGKIK